MAQTKQNRVASRGKAAGRGRKAQGSRRGTRTSSRKDLTPGARRGLSAKEIRLDSGGEVTGPLAETIAQRGGVLLGGYREPLSGRSIAVAALPVTAVQPTPFQRDLSPTHAKRLAEKIEEAGSFLDPIIVVKGSDGALWTPNGSHRLAAAKKLGLQYVTCLCSDDEALAYRILALNTEKAHNLKDRCLEVVRMARRLAEERPRAKESGFSDLFEAPEHLTLGLVYEQNKRFGGGAYRPFLRKVDRFADRGMAVSLRQREAYADRLAAIDTEVVRITKELKGRGFESPALRSYVVARINPVRFHRAKRGDDTPPMAMGAALTRMAALARRFDASSVKLGELALVAAVTEADE